MAIKFGFFNSINGDRKYNADDMCEYINQVISSGVVPTAANSLQITTNEADMEVQIQPGKAYINGHWITNDSILNLTVDPADVILKRCDRIVITCDLNTPNRNMAIWILKGTPSENYIIPPIISDPNVTTLTLGYIYIDPNVTYIATNKIEDKRADTGECGWVRLLVETTGSHGVLKKYQSYQTLTAEVSSVLPNIPQYDSNSVMQVYVGGIMMTENEDYTISGTGSVASITFTNSIRAGNKIICIVLKIE